MKNALKHIVVVPDGNRRWAKKRGLPPFFGHRQGAKIMEKISRAALDLKIPYFTMWCCSADNLTKRSRKEVDFLLNIFARYFKKLIKTKEIHQNRVKINVLGGWEKLLPDKVKQPIKALIEKTKDYRDYQLTLLMAYSGLDEMTEAIKKIAHLTSRYQE